MRRRSCGKTRNCSPRRRNSTPVARDLKVTDPGTQHWAHLHLHPRPLAGHAQADPRPRPAPRVLHAVRRSRGPGRPVQLRSRDEQPPHRRPRQGRGGTWAGRRPRTTSRRGPASPTGSTRRRWCGGGYGVSIIPFPDNQYAFNFPVKQNNQFNPPVSFAPAGSYGGRLPAAHHGRHPRGRDHPGQHAPAARAAVQRGAPRPVGGEGPRLERGLQRQLPWRFTGEIAYVANRGRGVLGRLELNAGLTPGLDNAGRPYFARFNRTASSTGWSKTTRATTPCR